MSIIHGLFDVIINVTTNSGNSTSWTDVTHYGGGNFDSWDW